MEKSPTTIVESITPSLFFLNIALEGKRFSPGGQDTRGPLSWDGRDPSPLFFLARFHAIFRPDPSQSFFKTLAAASIRYDYDGFCFALPDKTKDQSRRHHHHCRDSQVDSTRWRSHPLVSGSGTARSTCNQSSSLTSSRQWNGRMQHMSCILPIAPGRRRLLPCWWISCAFETSYRREVLPAVQ
jgi:hypothetical protein